MCLLLSGVFFNISLYIQIEINITQSSLQILFPARCQEAEMMFGGHRYLYSFAFNASVQLNHQNISTIVLNEEN